VTLGGFGFNARSRRAGAEHKRDAGKFRKFPYFHLRYSEIRGIRVENRLIL
jgi:hypothetical protein